MQLKQGGLRPIEQTTIPGLRSHFQRGIGFIEVLVSLLVITIGVLGMAGLHSLSLQYNQAAYLHSRATFLAGDMLDRVHTNTELARSGNNYSVGADEEVIAQCSEANYPDDCEAGACSPEELALYDIKQWKFNMACELPGAKGIVSFSDSSDGRMYTIRFSFPDQGNSVPVGDIVLRGAL